MIFHNQYTLTIGQYEIMKLTGNKQVLCKLPFNVPKKHIDKAFKHLMLDYNDKANNVKLQELLDKDYERLGVNCKAMKLECLCEMINICAKIGDTTPEFEDRYYAYYGKKPKTEGDFQKPFKDLERLANKAEQYFSEDISKEENVTDLINSIELSLSTKIRNDKFYLLNSYINEAVRRNPKKNG